MFGQSLKIISWFFLLEEKGKAMTKSTGKYVKRGTAFTVGKVFGRLTVIGPIESYRIPCECDCGKRLIVHRNNLGRSVNSCGCLRIDFGKTNNLTHGMSNSSEYKSWVGMRARCSNPNETGYENYGGRGIKVCERWLESFDNFFEDMGVKPKGNRVSIERLDNDGNYEPGNCVWSISAKSQARNRRSNRVIEHAGMSGTLTDWAEHIGVSVGVLAARLDKLGKTMDEAIVMGAARHGRSFGKHKK